MIVPTILGQRFLLMFDETSAERVQKCFKDNEPLYKTLVRLPYAHSTVISQAYLRSKEGSFVKRASLCADYDIVFAEAYSTLLQNISLQLYYSLRSLPACKQASLSSIHEECRAYVYLLNKPNDACVRILGFGLDEFSRISSPLWRRMVGLQNFMVGLKAILDLKHASQARCWHEIMEQIDFENRAEFLGFLQQIAEKSQNNLLNVEFLQQPIIRFFSPMLAPLFSTEIQLRLFLRMLTIRIFVSKHSCDLSVWEELLDWFKITYHLLYHLAALSVQAAQQSGKIKVKPPVKQKKVVHHQHLLLLSCS